jgi:Uri superfamily endonuclease
MVFSKLLNNLTGLLSTGPNKGQEGNNKNNNEVLINELQQGMKLLNNRKKKMDKLEGRILMIENLSGFAKGEETLQKTSQNEIQILKDLETNYNKQLAKYAIDYKSFMGNYYRAVENVKKCKATCLVSIPDSGDKSANSRDACKVGCDLKGPYVQACENTFKTSRVGSESCDTLTKGRCSAGNVELGSNGDVTSGDYADSNNTTIKDGCCECGGGAGGPSSAIMMGKKITKCDEIPGAYKFSGSSGDYMSAACHGARVTDSEKNSNMHIKYLELANQNKELITSATAIFNKIEELTKTNTAIDTSMDESDLKFKNQLTEYRTIYSDIISRQGKTDGTIDAQLEDIRYKEDSSQLRLWIWTGLAILTILFAIQKMRK